MGKIKIAKEKSKITFNKSLLALFIVLFITIGLINNNFFNPNYIINVMLKNIVEVGLIALPLTLIVISGGIDFSIGAIMILSALCGGMIAGVYGNTAGLAVTLLVGLVCGFINGLVITKIQLTPLVATLATWMLFNGLARGITLGDSVYAFDSASFMGNTMVLGLPLAVIIYIILAAAFSIVVLLTTFGRKLYAMGLNENSSKFSGVKTDNIKMALYTICGFVCAIAALIYLGRFTSIKYNADNTLNLKIITIIVLGGTSINGGVGDVRGTIIATLIIAVLNSGLTVLNIPIDVQTIIHGMVLIISLIVYSIIIEREKKKRVHEDAKSHEN